MSYTILVAEDVDHNFLLIKAILKNKFNLIHAKNGKEALNLFNINHPDLVLMDIKMPEMDGFEATRQIRSSDNNRTPIIALTAYAFSSDKEKALAAGCNDLITKPVDPVLLKETIDFYLNII